MVWHHLEVWVLTYRGKLKKRGEQGCRPWVEPRITSSWCLTRCRPGAGGIEGVLLALLQQLGAMLYEPKRTRKVPQKQEEKMEVGVIGIERMGMPATPGRVLGWLGEVPGPLNTGSQERYTERTKHTRLKEGYRCNTSS
jgi:hypothetical protein